MKKLISLLLTAALMLSLGGCGKIQTKEDAPDTVTVTDHTGSSVTVPKNAQRIAVCGIFPLPSVLTVFFDSADKLVGIPKESMAAAKNSLLAELYPQLLNAKTEYTNGNEINTEELMTLAPDVVFYSADNKIMGQQLKDAGFTAVGISANLKDYNAIETLESWIDLLGQIYPKNDRAKTVSDYSEKIYKTVQERVSSLKDTERARVFFLFKYSDTQIVTSGDNFFGDWWADSIGAVNVAKELGGDNGQPVNLEQVYSWNPDIIFMTNFNTSTPDDLYNNTVGAYDWSGISAIQKKQVYKMPLGMYRSYTTGVDTPVTLLWLAKTTYPDLFSDIDITEETKKYYKQVFDIELTDKQANSIFNPSLSAGM